MRYTIHIAVPSRLELSKALIEEALRPIGDFTCIVTENPRRKAPSLVRLERESPHTFGPSEPADTSPVDASLARAISRILVRLQEVRPEPPNS